MRAVPQFAVVRREYVMHAWAGVYTDSYRACVEATTMTLTWARALAGKSYKAAGEPDDGVTWVVEALTDEARAILHPPFRLDDEIPF